MTRPSQGPLLAVVSTMGTPAKKDQEAEKVDVVDLKLGVWAIRMAKTPSRQQPHKFWTDIREGLPFLLRFACDVFLISPYYSIIYLFFQLTQGLEIMLLLRSSNKLLTTVESGLRSGNPDVSAIIVDTSYRIGCAVLFAVIGVYSNRVCITMRNQVLNHFNVLVMKANLGLDLAGSQDAANKALPEATEAWEALETVIYLLKNIVEIGSQLAFIIHLSKRSLGGPFFILTCLIYPLSARYMSFSIFRNPLYGYIKDPFYSRMLALESFANGDLRQDIISNGLENWIASEYERADANLGDDSTQHPRQQTDLSVLNFVKQVFLRLTQISPMIYCSVLAALNPSKFSVSSIAILQQSSSQLRSYLRFLLSYGSTISRTLVTLKRFYKLQEQVSSSPNLKGIIQYPPPKSDSGLSTKGMSFDLNNVSFSYPGTQSTAPALNGASLKIKAGQLIVIVGANGGGKSTLIRILARLYEPTSGTVFVDNRPSTDYIVSDLHQATALLSQDNQLFPLSLLENIGLGFPDKLSDGTLISQAADDGDATSVMSKLKDGKETILLPLLNTFEMNLHKDKSPVLYKEMQELSKKTDISGGERQKVVAARTFMRFNSGKIKFVAVDEPSSALDAEAELRLFQNLIKYRGGKTLVFVTHRFGHLTKYADQIICMKDGYICESGSHEALMARQGEYAKLYEIQASAFSRK